MHNMTEALVDALETLAENINLVSIIALTAMFLIGYLMGRSHTRKDPQRIGNRRRRNIRADNTVDRARRYERGGASADEADLPGAAKHHLRQGARTEAADAVRAANPGMSLFAARRAVDRWASENGL